MQPTSAQDYKKLLTDVIKKQVVILGPDITLSKARNVKGLTVADDGTVTSVDGNPQEVTQALIDQFVQLSGLIVKKTMEPLLSLSQPTPAQTTEPPVPSQPTPQPPLPAQPMQEPTAPVEPMPQPQAPSQTPTQPSTPVASDSAPKPIPASNPLAA